MKKLFLSVCLLLAVHVPAQDKLSDSLQALLRGNLHDTVRLDALFRLAANAASETDMRRYATQTLELGTKLERSGEAAIARKAKRRIAGVHALYGALYTRNREADKALAEYQEALRIREEVKDSLAISYVLNELGFLHNVQGKPGLALQYFMKALKIQEKFAQKSDVGYTLINIGFIHYNQRLMQQALDYYRRSLKLQEQAGNDHGIAYALSNIASVLQTDGKVKEALEANLKALRLREGMGDKEGAAVSLNLIAHIYNNEGRPERGLEYMQRSLRYYEDINDREGVATSLNDLGWIYFDMKQAAQAAALGRRALNLSQELGFPANIKNAARLLANAYAAQGKYKEAYQYFLLFSAMKDSVLNSDSHRQIAEMQARYETDKQKQQIRLLNSEKEKQAALSRAESQKQKNILLSVCAVLALVLIVAVFIYRGYKQKQKANIIITRQKEEVELAKQLVEEKQKEILDSIYYARRIQTGLLPPEKYIARTLTRLNKTPS